MPVLTLEDHREQLIIRVIDQGLGIAAIHRGREPARDCGISANIDVD
ncbi:hypothetical protein [Pseudomonas reinekei]|nr:hypothetical protein [Pseudomonas reinekei]